STTSSIVRPRVSRKKRACSLVPCRSKRPSYSVGRVTITARGGSVPDMASAPRFVALEALGLRPQHALEQRAEHVRAQREVLDVVELAGELAGGEPHERGGREVAVDVHPIALGGDLRVLEHADALGLRGRAEGDVLRR